MVGQLRIIWDYRSSYGPQTTSTSYVNKLVPVLDEVVG